VSRPLKYVWLTSTKERPTHRPQTIHTSNLCTPVELVLQITTDHHSTMRNSTSRPDQYTKWGLLPGSFLGYCLFCYNSLYEY